MPTIAKDDTYRVMVYVTTKPGKQDEFLTHVTEKIEREISKEPGFISSSFMKAPDGKTCFNYAEWESVEHYREFSKKPYPDVLAVFETYTDASEIYYPVEVVRIIEPT